MKSQFTEALIYWKESIMENLPSIALGLLLLAIFTLLGYLLQFLIRKKFLKRMEDRLLINFLGKIIFAVMFVIGVVTFLNQVGLGQAASGVLAGAGVTAIILGFAFRDIGENFLSGFFLAFGRPFGIGDVIGIDRFKGKVRALNLRNTHIRTFDGIDIYIPNAMLIKMPLQNYTRDGLLRHDFVIGLDYGADLARAGKTILKVLQSDTRIEQQGDLRPFVQLDEFSASTVNIRIFYWISSGNFTINAADLKTEVMSHVVQALLHDGFKLPADIVELRKYHEQETTS